jgi:hypothetical protein
MPTPTWSPTREGEGLDVEQADALAYLEAQPTRPSVESSPARSSSTFRLPCCSASWSSQPRSSAPAACSSRDDQPALAAALRSYFADLTHAQPLVPETLAMLAKQAGFREVETRFLNAPRHADDVDERIREILFAPLDYAIVART